MGWGTLLRPSLETVTCLQDPPGLFSFLHHPFLYVGVREGWKEDSSFFFKPSNILVNLIILSFCSCHWLMETNTETLLLFPLQLMAVIPKWPGCEERERVKDGTAGYLRRVSPTAVSPTKIKRISETCENLSGNIYKALAIKLELEPVCPFSAETTPCRVWPSCRAAAVAKQG